MRTFEHSTEIPCSAAELWAWHQRPLAFERLVPPWQEVEVTLPLPHMAVGQRTAVRVGIGPLVSPWTARIEAASDGRDGGEAGFVDVQEQGPFASWRHRHRFIPVDAARCRLVDQVEYTLPGGAIGALLGGRAAHSTLERLFRFRHDTTRMDVALQHELAAFATGPLNVLITGASGLLGSELRTLLSVLGHRPLRAVRRAPRADDEVQWDVGSGTLATDAAIDAVVHLAGESIADGRLGAAHLERVRASRVDATLRLVEGIARLSAPPKVLVCASAVGFYGSRGDALLDEDSAAGTGLLPEICAAWEDAAATVERLGVRRVSVRMGIVLSPRGGALKKLLPVFQSGLGGHQGDGRFFQPLLAVDDAAAVLARALLDARVRGALNAVGPEPVTNAVFSSTLAHVLHRPALVPVPAAALRGAFGALADEALLASARVVPARLAALGHRFRHANVEDALRHVLGRHQEVAHAGA